MSRERRWDEGALEKLATVDRDLFMQLYCNQDDPIARARRKGKNDVLLPPNDPGCRLVSPRSTGAVWCPVCRHHWGAPRCLHLASVPRFAGRVMAGVPAVDAVAGEDNPWATAVHRMNWTFQDVEGMRVIGHGAGRSRRGASEFGRFGGAGLAR
jgi:hypothetical protein